MSLTPYFQDESVTLYCGDCRDILPLLSGVTAVVTDPPYGLEFMGKEWDRFSGSFSKTTDWAHGNLGGLPRQRVRNIKCEECGKWVYDHPPNNCVCGGVRRQQMHNFEAFMFQWAQLLLTCCLPGAPLLAFGGTRTWHRMVCAIEDAGWEIRDTLMWLYGSGFPKSLDISKAIDKAAGVDREIVGSAMGMTPERPGGAGTFRDDSWEPEAKTIPVTAPATSAAKEWQGYGTALKPAWEPVCLAMKPLDGTFAHNALTHGVAGLNVDGARIEAGGDYVDGGVRYGASAMPQMGRHQTRPWVQERIENNEPVKETHAHPQGRFPSNLLLDEVSAAMLDEQSGVGKDGVAVGGYKTASSIYGTFLGRKADAPDVGYGGHGGASRFFYCAKASRAERGGDNDHPTVKPLALMTYLVKLIAPPQNSLILDPFMGSGTTGLACQRLGVRFIGIDSNERNCEIAAKRLRQLVAAF